MKSFNKFYIHHRFSKDLFYKIFHNTTEVVYDINQNDEGNVEFKYNNITYTAEFLNKIHNNQDGYHIIDFLTYYSNIKTNNKELFTYKKIYEILVDKKNWILFLLRTEKILLTETLIGLTYDNSHEIYIKNILKNNIIITDNNIIREVTSIPHIQNLFYSFSNSIFNWNSYINIRWFYEFKSIYEKLDFDYRIAFSVRNPKPHRLEILKHLSILDDKTLFLQLSTFIYEIEEFNLSGIKDKILNEIKDYNIKLNNIVGDYDFDDISSMKIWNHGIDFDLFFRYLSKSKIQILDESWSFSPSEFNTQYLSEKTLGYVLSNIPFIPTHSYPIEILQQVLDINSYPFFKQIKSIQGNPKKFAKFVNEFLQNFEHNYSELYKWSSDVHNTFMKKLNSENSFIDLLQNNFENKNMYIKASLI